ncbi:MAG: hypothetical protein IPH78_01240 [Bacteroidetes bacterium]|nr:hypothetical protein [Bacteroidota bacterium]
MRFNSWWQYKIPPLLAIFFTVKITELGATSQVNDCLQLALLFCWMFTAAAFGYFVNDFSDIEEDNLAGKSNLVQRIPYGFRILVFFLLGLTVIAFQLILNHPTSVAFQLSLLHLAVFVAYSVRPVRLKERSFWGALCDALYTHFTGWHCVFNGY